MDTHAVHRRNNFHCSFAAGRDNFSAACVRRIKPIKPPGIRGHFRDDHDAVNCHGIQSQHPPDNGALSPRHTSQDRLSEYKEPMNETA
jgi:hypothetical protein